MRIEQPIIDLKDQGAFEEGIRILEAAGKQGKCTRHHNLRPEKEAFYKALKKLSGTIPTEEIHQVSQDLKRSIAIAFLLQAEREELIDALYLSYGEAINKIVNEAITSYEKKKQLEELAIYGAEHRGQTVEKLVHLGHVNAFATIRAILNLAPKLFKDQFGREAKAPQRMGLCHTSLPLVMSIAKLHLAGSTGGVQTHMMYLEEHDLIAIPSAWVIGRNQTGALAIGPRPEHANAITEAQRSLRSDQIGCPMAGISVHMHKDMCDLTEEALRYSGYPHSIEMLLHLRDHFLRRFSS